MMPNKKPPIISIKVTPLTFDIDADGGQKVIVIENTCAERLCFKLKTTNVENYKLSKIYGFVEVGQSTDFTVTRSKGVPKTDRFVVHFTAIGKDVTDPTLAFSKHDQAANIYTLNIFVNAIIPKSTAEAPADKEDSFKPSPYELTMPILPPK